MIVPKLVNYRSNSKKYALINHASALVIECKISPHLFSLN